MSPVTRPLSTFFRIVRTVAIAALVSAAFLACPLSPARADSSTNSSLQLAQNATDTTSNKMETLEQRITDLHTALKITPDEEVKWNAVAQVMRDNAAAMQKLVMEKRAKMPENMTALDDLVTYQAFAQAHVDGLKNLVTAFTSLYDSMPDAQKKNADMVFQNFRHDKAGSNG